MTNPERCSCGAREKNKSSKETEHNTGKMCFKPEDYPELPEISLEKSIEISGRGRKNILDKYSNDNKAFDELTERLWKDRPEEMVEAQAWAKNFIDEIKNEPIN